MKKYRQISNCIYSKYLSEQNSTSLIHILCNNMFFKAYIVISLILVCFFILSCGHPPIKLNQADNEYAPKEYPMIFEKWSRKNVIHENFLAQAFFNVTFLSLEMRRATLSKYQEMYQLPPNEVEQRRIRNESEGREYYDFFTAISTARSEWNNLDDDDTVWRVTMLNQKNEEMVAKSVVAVDEESIELRKLYPYIDEYSKCYRVRFVRVPPGRTTDFLADEDGKISLKFSGPVGQAELIWLLK